jgi:hypothetical protein
MQALQTVTTGIQNTAVGMAVMQGDGLTAITGSNNVGIGTPSLFKITSGGTNVGVGGSTLQNTKTGSGNSAIGQAASADNTEGSFHTAIGREAFRFNSSSILTLGAITGGSGYTDGTYTPVSLSLISAQSGIVTVIVAPTATIVVSGGAVTSVTLIGLGNQIAAGMIFTADAASIGGTGTGFEVPVSTLTTPTNNTAYGYHAGRNNLTGFRNVFLGAEAGKDETTSDNLYISNTSTATPLIKGKFDSAGGNLGSVRIYGDFQVTTKTPATAASTGTVGTITYDNDYIYVCIATDTWKRVAISTW